MASSIIETSNSIREYLMENVIRVSKIIGAISIITAAIWSVLNQILSFFYTNMETFVKSHEDSVILFIIVVAMMIVKWYLISKEVTEVKNAVDDSVGNIRTDIQLLNEAFVRNAIAAFYYRHKKAKTLTDEEKRELFQLEEMRRRLNINSYNEWRLQKLREIADEEVESNRTSG